MSPRTFSCLTPGILGAVTLLVACGEDHPPPPCLGACDAGIACETQYDPPPSTSDTDGDGVVDDEDDDADGDGLSNEYENFGGFLCADHDPDGDGIDNWLDTDSDNDGLLDGTERAGPSDEYKVDTDNDGFSDLHEIAAGTNPADETSKPRSRDVVAVLPHMSGDVVVSLRLENRIENADVFLLVDTTGSMRAERGGLVSAINTVIIPALTEAFTDVQIGAGGLDDYPVSGFGSEGDVPFYLTSKIVPADLDEGRWSIEGSCPTRVGKINPPPNGSPDIEDALRGLACHSGNDVPESFLPALWAVATGEGLEWTGGSIPPAECPGDRFGYPCFRTEAVPIIVLFGDAPFHNGPDFSNPYGFSAPDWDDAIRELNRIRARVTSVYSGPDDDAIRSNYEALARATGATFLDGEPMVFDIDGEGMGLDTTLVDALKNFADGVEQDISLTLENGPDNGAVNALDFVASSWTEEGYSPSGIPGAVPGVSYESKDVSTFYGVAPGAQVEFTITLRNDSLAPTDEAQVITLIARAIGDAGTSFASRRIYLFVARGALNFASVMPAGT